MLALAASLALVFLGVAAVGAQNDDRPLPDADTFLARARERVASNSLGDLDVPEFIPRR